MVDSDKAKTVILERSSRETRGKRMTKLLDEEIEEDELLWNQDALKEEENDINYEEVPEAADVFNGDFDEDEPELDDDGENVVEERLPFEKRLIFPGKTLRKKKTKKKVTSKQDTVLKTESASEKNKSPSESQDVNNDTEVERTIRKSTRTSAIVRQAERDAIRAALQATMRCMLAKEEEVKKRAIVHKAAYTGISLLEFSKGASFQSEICTSSLPYPQKAVCVITGLPAKYRDPRTGLPYATKEAFKVIQERYLKEESHRKQQAKLDMRSLFASIEGAGFSSKRKRSTDGRTKASDWRLGARFRRIPALENLDVD